MKLARQFGSKQFEATFGADVRASFIILSVVEGPPRSLRKTV